MAGIVGLRIKQLWVLLLAIVLSGCAATVTKTEKDSAEDLVAKKAQARWDMLLKSDLDAAYEYLSPASRAVISLDAYKRRIGAGRWKRADVNTVVCAGDRCDVVIMLEYSYRDMKSITRPLDEVWLKDGGEWWFSPGK